MLYNIRNLLYLMVFFFPLLVYGQNPIPNADLENWTGNIPDGWISNGGRITPSTDAFSGNYSARMEVIDSLGGPFPPVLYPGNGSGFPVSERHAALTGYYKLDPQVGDFINVNIYMYDNGGTHLVGTGHGTFPDAASDWTQFSVNINYFDPGVPDNCYLEIGVGIFESTGGVGMIDNLELGGTTGIEELIISQIPEKFELTQNFPNPFNPATHIQFSIPKSTFVKLEVFNTLGKQVAKLIAEELDAGTYNYNWNAMDLTSGIYYLRIKAESFTAIRKMILLK